MARSAMLSHQSKFTKQRPTMADPKLTPGTLYIDRDQDLLSGDWGQYIKIGIVRNDKEAALRNKEHQTGNPRLIHVMHAFESTMVEDLETQLHHIFAPHRVLGEWFLLDDQAVASRVIPEAKRIIAEQHRCLGAFQSKAKLKTIESTGIVRAPAPEEIQLHSLVVKAKHELDIKQAKIHHILMAYLIHVNLPTGVQNSRFQGSPPVLPSKRKKSRVEKIS